MNCPIDGCEYSVEKATEEQTRNSLVAHMSGMKDDGHEGLGYRTAPQLLEARDAFENTPDSDEATNDPTPDPDPEPEQGTTDTPEATADGGGDNPAFGGPDPDPQQTANSNQEGGDGEDIYPCPNPDCDETHDISGLSPGKYNCSVCGREMRVTDE